MVHGFVTMLLESELEHAREVIADAAADLRSFLDVE